MEPAEDWAEKERDLAARELKLKQQELEARERAIAAREAEENVPPAPPTDEPESNTRQEGSEGARKAAAEEQKPVARGAVFDPTKPHAVSMIATINIDLSKPGGKPWDPLGDAPDPRVSVSGAQPKSYKNTLNVSAPFMLNLKKGDTVSIQVEDKDAVASDPIGAHVATYPGRATTKNVKLGAAMMTLEFKPKPPKPCDCPPGDPTCSCL